MRQEFIEAVARICRTFANMDVTNGRHHFLHRDGPSFRDLAGLTEVFIRLVPHSVFLVALLPFPFG